MFQHQCTKPGCGTSYEDASEDAYLCPLHLSERNRLAAEMDGKFNTRDQQPSGVLAAYDAARGNNKFPSAAALGIKL